MATFVIVHLCVSSSLFVMYNTVPGV
jgi:hypothetical protein